MFQIQNNSIEDVNPILDMLNQFIPFSQKRLGFNKPVSLFLQSDEENANKILGKTAFYNPSEFSVTVFTSGRHPKDILRSLSHELVHHAQNCRGDFEGDHIAGEGYAQKDPHMRNMEREAYERGNIIFRDFEDLIKADEINITLSGDAKMSIKEWKDKELNMLLMEKWGYRRDDNVNPLWPSDGPRRHEDSDFEAGLQGQGGGPGDEHWRGFATEMDINPDAAARHESTDTAVWPPRELREACPDIEGKELEIDISEPGMGIEVQVQDLEDLSPDEAFGAGWAAAAQKIEDALAAGPEEAVEAGDEMGEEEDEDLMEQDGAVRRPKAKGEASGLDRGDVASLAGGSNIGSRRHAGSADIEDLGSRKRLEKAGIADPGKHSGAREKFAAQPARIRQPAAKSQEREAAGRAKPGAWSKQQESLSLAEAKEIAKRIFTKILRENGDDDDSAGDDDDSAAAPSTPTTTATPRVQGGTSSVGGMTAAEAAVEKKAAKATLRSRSTKSTKTKASDAFDELDEEKVKPKSVPQHLKDRPKELRKKMKKGKKSGAPTSIKTLPVDAQETLANVETDVSSVTGKGKKEPRRRLAMRKGTAEPEEKMHPGETGAKATDAEPGDLFKKKNGSLSIDEAKVIAKKIFEKLLSGQ